MNRIVEYVFHPSRSAAMCRSQLFPLVLAACAVGGDRLRAASPAVGERHPDFTLADIATGKPVSLSDFRGKKVLLIQFAAW